MQEAALESGCREVRKTVNVKNTDGHRARYAAHRPTSSALGVWACTICGDKRRNSRTSFMTDRASHTGLILRGISTPQTGTCSAAENASRARPGEETAWRSNPCSRRNAACPTKKFRVSGMLVRWTTFRRQAGSAAAMVRKGPAVEILPILPV